MNSRNLLDHVRLSEMRGSLRLTIAKYLTPGDISIQEVGIVPDIELAPTKVTKERLDVFAPRKTVGEADLDRHFGNSESAKVAKKRSEVEAREKPAELLKYLKEEPKEKEKELAAKPKEEKKPKGKQGDKDPLPDVDVSGEDLDDQMDAEAQDEIKEDFEVLFARDFVLKAPHIDRRKMLEVGQPFVEEKRREEEERINQAIGQLGVNWKVGDASKDVRLTAILKPGMDQKVQAGEIVQLELSVKNDGKTAINRLRAWTESENVFLDRREFVFGHLEPGDKRTWTVPVKLPKDLSSRRDDVTVKFFDDGGQLPETLVSEINFVELPRPVFAFNYQVIDSCTACNGDGQTQRGEEVVLLVDVTNVGRGKALDSFAQIKNAADQNIFIEKGRFKLGELEPGETKTARFVLEVKKAYKDSTFPLKIAIIDEPLEEFTTEKMTIPVYEPVSAPHVLRGALADGFLIHVVDGRDQRRADRAAVRAG